MLSNSKNKSTTAPQALLNLIGLGTVIKGDIQCNGDIRIDGSVHGKMDVGQKLVIGESGNVQGNVKASNVSVSGIITGNILCEETTIFHATSKITGDVQTKQIIIEQGAIFNGNCTMGTVKKNSNIVEARANYESTES
jgi:cytoskeletal protein CcmA (bactofilin family)